MGLKSEIVFVIRVCATVLDTTFKATPTQSDFYRQDLIWLQNAKGVKEVSPIGTAKNVVNAT